MATSLVLGNGNLLINLNESFNMTDLYWPHVGQENHLAKKANEVFLRVDGQFSHISDSDWYCEPRYKTDSLVSEGSAKNDRLGLIINFEDCVLPDHDIYIREITIENTRQDSREVMLYFKHNFAMLEADIGDTAIWYPLSQVLCHYKKNRYLGIGSIDKLYQFSCAGPLDNKGKGCVPDEATGELAFNPVTTGSAQSCLSFKVQVEPNKSQRLHYFIVCGKSFDEINQRVEFVRKNSFTKLLESTEEYWKYWIGTKVRNYMGAVIPQLFKDELVNHDLLSLYKRSLLTIRTQFDNGGAIVAANDSTFLKEGGKDTYSYFWPRDGAMTSLALIEVGFSDLSKKFFRYCAKVITKDGYILHKYYPDIESGIGSSWHPWIDKLGELQLPIQEDETALVIYALWQHYKRFGDQEFLNEMWEPLIQPAMKFMLDYRYDRLTEHKNIAAFVTGYRGEIRENPLDEELEHTGLPRPGYDIWETEIGINAYTVATVHAALRAGAELFTYRGLHEDAQLYFKAAEDMKLAVEKYLYDHLTGTFYRRLYCDAVNMTCVKDTTVDTSLYALWAFDMFAVDDERIEKTMALIEDRLWLKTEAQGLARRENDFYHRSDPSVPGNPWYISALWMAQYWIRKYDFEKAGRYVKWVLDHKDETGLLPEQADPHTGFANSMKPLTWSHAELVKTVNLLMSK